MNAVIAQLAAAEKREKTSEWIAKSCVAPSLMVLEPDAGLALIESLPDTEAALLLFDEGQFQLRTTGGMDRHVEVVSDRIRKKSP